MISSVTYMLLGFAVAEVALTVSGQQGALWVIHTPLPCAVPVGQNGLKHVTPRPPPALASHLPDQRLLAPGQSLWCEGQVLQGLGSSAWTWRYTQGPLHRLRFSQRPHLAFPPWVVCGSYGPGQVVDQLAQATRVPRHSLGPVASTGSKQVACGKGCLVMEVTSSICVANQGAVVDPLAWTPQHVPIVKQAEGALSISSENTLECVGLWTETK